MNTFVIADPKKCIGCRTCEVACVLAHSNGAGVKALTAAHFIPRLKVIRTAKVSVPIQCHHCDDAPCLKVCSTGAIVFSNDSVQVNQQRCVGCKSCMVACPYGVVEIVTLEKLERAAGTHARQPNTVEAQKCDLCIEHRDGPSCIRVCPTKSLRFVDHKTASVVMKTRQENAALESGEITM